MGHRALWCWCVLLAGCEPVMPPPPVVRTLPPVGELPVQADPPDLFTSFFEEGRRAESVEDFTGWRRTELQTLFAHYVYGDDALVLFGDQNESAPLIAVDVGVAGAPAVDVRELSITLQDERVLHVAVFSAQGADGVATVLGPNKCGNQSLVPDARVRVTTSWLHPDCGAPAEEARGSQAALWPVADIVAAGFALATWHESDAAPDDALRDADHVLATWARANSLIAQRLMASPGAIDAARIAVFGHSRRGKAALLTAAFDSDVAAVVAHQSGRAGAPLSRNASGESIDLITRTFPHWFNDTFWQFAGQEERLPFDQHALVALAAPRPVLLVDGDADSWADPQNAEASAALAAPAWDLLGGPAPVWQSRPGDHSVTADDWAIFLEFLSARL